jgi:hypothetical protein
MESARHDVIDLELQANGQRIAFGHGRRLTTHFDTTALMDGPMVVRAIVRTPAGTSTTQHTLRVRNLRLQSLSPHELSLHGNHGGDVRANVRGPARVLLQLPSHRVELRVPGGAAVPMRSFALAPHHHDCAHGTLRFDRAALVAALRAAQSTGAIPPGARHVRVQLWVGDHMVGRERLTICSGGHRGGRR